MARLRAVVHGWVQGVGYRDFASREATRLRLSGYVRNASDGSVEIEAEGRRIELEAFLLALRRGPRYAEVREVEVAWGAHRAEFNGWDLRW
ncbi:MAG TPA: acylphosphatase [Candidatus Dormibacteraeota bacterium]|nr:acylphosphatase [Candidatus Dormibacteraeota bacterium]